MMNVIEIVRYQRPEVDHCGQAEQEILNLGKITLNPSIVPGLRVAQLSAAKEECPEEKLSQDQGDKSEHKLRLALRECATTSETISQDMSMAQLSVNLTNRKISDMSLAQSDCEKEKLELSLALQSNKW